jgi:hypothetical protein
MMKPLAIALSVVGKGLQGGTLGSNVTSIQHEANLNCHDESSLYNKYTLIKNGKTYFAGIRLTVYGRQALFH